MIALPQVTWEWARPWSRGHYPRQDREVGHSQEDPRRGPAVLQPRDAEGLWRPPEAGRERGTDSLRASRRKQPWDPCTSDARPPRQREETLPLFPTARSGALLRQARGIARTPNFPAALCPPGRAERAPHITPQDSPPGRHPSPVSTPRAHLPGSLSLVTLGPRHLIAEGVTETSVTGFFSSGQHGERRVPHIGRARLLAGAGEAAVVETRHLLRELRPRRQTPSVTVTSLGHTLPHCSSRAAT